MSILTVQPKERRPMLAIIGNAGEIPEAQRQAAFDIGRLAIDQGFRIVCGGMDGVMQAAAQGAHASERYREGDTIGIGMSYRGKDVNPWIDVVVPTGLGFSRNMLVVASGDVVVAIGGGSGTLSEIALAWQIQRPILAYTSSSGWAGKLGGISLDARNAYTIEPFDDVHALVKRAWELVPFSRSQRDDGRG